MIDELRERVARVLAEGQGEIHEGTWKYYLNDADAAIALIRGEVLEEAAKVADELSDRWTKEWRAGLKADSRLEAFSDGAEDVAFAIRALKDQTTT